MAFLLANMTEFGKSKLLNKKQLENLGYNLVIYPVTTQRLAMQNVESGLKSIFKDGDQNKIVDKMQTRKRLYELVEYENTILLEKKLQIFLQKGMNNGEGIKKGLLGIVVDKTTISHVVP